MQPKVSIIVPIYKVPENLLCQCIESLTKQTLKDIEIILVDDGSPDDCGKICDEYASKDCRINVIHKQNGGLVSARNAGFDAVTGEWHMYLDGDDWIDNDTCEAVLKYAEKYEGLDVVFWKCIQELGDKSIKGKWEWPCNDSEHLYVNEECIELARNVLVYKSGIATAYCKLINTEYARKNGIKHDNRLKQGMEGTEFSLRTFYNAKKSLYVNAYWNHYLFNPDSISKKCSEENTKFQLDCFNVINEVINELNETVSTKDSYRQALYQRICYALVAIAMSTYFHPSNNESFFLRAKKYDKVIRNNSLFHIAITHASLVNMDKKRRFTIFCAKYRLYFFVEMIARVKQFMLKQGKFDY